MKGSFVFTVSLAAMMIVSCSKPADDPHHVPPPPPPPTDARTVLLKDVLIDRLPSPYFHFVYNDSSYVTKIEFAQQLFSWDVQYENKRVKKLINKNNDQLIYQYENGKVVSIKHIDAVTGKPEWHFDFTYNANTNLVKQIRWFSFHDRPGDSIMERKVVLIYHPDGNLAEFDEYRRNPNNDEMHWTSTVELNNYDNGTNVDDFYLFKDFFDDLLFLPQVKLQKNNARELKITGTTNDFKIDYTYQYNAGGLPTSRTYVMEQTRGTDAGKKFSGGEHFSYY